MALRVTLFLTSRLFCSWYQFFKTDFNWKDQSFYPIYAAVILVLLFAIYEQTKT